MTQPEVRADGFKIYRVSPSLLADVIECKTQAWVRHIKGYTSITEHLKAVAGQGFHAGVAVYLDPESTTPFSAERALAAFHHIYDDVFTRVPPEQLEPRMTPGNLHRVLARWLEMHPPEILPWKRVLAVETAFVSRRWKITADVGVELIVRPDAIVEAFDDSIRFMDTKSTGWRIGDTSWKENLKLSSQIALYTDSVLRRYGDRAALGGWINAMELNQLPSDPKRICKTFNGGAGHNVPYSECGHEHAKMELMECMTHEDWLNFILITARKAAEWFVAMHAVADAHGLLEVDGAFHGACRFCPARAWCDAQRQTAALDSMLVYEPWPIEEGKRVLE